MKDLFSKTIVGIRYIESQNNIVTLSKGDFENLVQRIEKYEEKNIIEQTKKKIDKQIEYNDEKIVGLHMLGHVHSPTTENLRGYNRGLYRVKEIINELEKDEKAVEK